MVAATKLKKSETQPLRKGLEIDSSSTAEDDAAFRASNPYANTVPDGPAAQLMRQFKSFTYMFVCMYLLHLMEVYHNVLHSSHIRHSWFSMALASSVAILGIKSYAELYEGKIKKSKVNYDNFRQTTHAIIFLFVFTGICLHVALWPVYGFQTFAVTIAFGYGIVLQIMIAFPVYAQNFIGTVALMFFIQQYNSL